MENLRAHSQRTKAHTLDSLTTMLLGYVPTESDNKDMNVDMLLLLFELAQSPLHHTAYEPPQDLSILQVVTRSSDILATPSAEKECTITNAWLGDYLDDWDTDSDSDSDSELQKSMHEDGQDNAISDDSPSAPGTPWALRHAVRRDEPIIEYPAVTLGKGVQVQEFALHHHRSLGPTYQKWLASHTLFETANELNTLPEHEIVQQAALALQGISGVCFQLSSHKGVLRFQINPHIAVTHLTQSSLHAILARIAESATVLARVTLRTAEVAKANGRTCNTWEAFKASAAGQLSQFHCQVAEIGATATLLRFCDWLETDPCLPFLLHEVLQKAGLLDIDVGELPIANMPMIASKLLSSLYLMAADEALLCHRTRRRAVLLHLFADSMSPYCIMLEQWLHLGRVQDPCSEFMILEQSASAGLIASMDHLTLREASAAGDDDADSSSAFYKPSAASPNPAVPCFLQMVAWEILVTGKAVQLLHVMGLTVSSELARITQQQLDIAKSALQAAKESEVPNVDFARTLSRERLHHLSLTYDINTAESKHQSVLANSPMPQQPLHMTLWKGIISSQLRAQTACSTEDPAASSSCPQSPVSKQLFVDDNIWPAELIERQSFVSTGLMPPPSSCNPDSTMKSYYLSAVAFDEVDHIRQQEPPVVDPNDFEAAAANELSIPLVETLDLHLIQHIRLQHELTSAAVLRVLMEDCKLMQHLSALRAFFFQAEGNALHEFTDALFSKMHDESQAGSTYELNNLLQQSLAHTDMFGAQLVSCEVGGDVVGNNAIDSLARVQLNYQADWPVNLIITQKALTKYNLVFGFILQIKRSLYFLSQVFDWSKRTPLAASHQAQLFQAELRHFVNALNHYVMTRVVQTMWREQRERIAMAADVNDLTNTHTRYLDTVLRCCLLSTDGTQSRVMDFLLGILSLVLDFSVMYQKYLISIGVMTKDTSRETNKYEDEDDDAPVETHRDMDADELAAQMLIELEEIKRNFRQKHRLLVIILQKKIEKGHFLFLEDLYTRLNFNSFYHI